MCDVGGGGRGSYGGCTALGSLWRGEVDGIHGGIADLDGVDCRFPRHAARDLIGARPVRAREWDSSSKDLRERVGVSEGEGGGRAVG